MIIDLIHVNNNAESSLIKFIFSIKKFNFSFKKFDNIIEMNNPTLLIFPKNTGDDFYKKIEKKLSTYNSSNLIYFIPITLSKLTNKNNQQLIFYPLQINYFEEKLLSLISNNKVDFKNIVVNKNNMLINKINNKQLYLTESEVKIIKLIFLNKTISKEKIKNEVLNLKPEIESKSLETHLSRLRKKIATIAPNISIISDDKKNIKIINISQEVDLLN